MPLQFFHDYCLVSNAKPLRPAHSDFFSRLRHVAVDGRANCLPASRRPVFFHHEVFFLVLDSELRLSVNVENCASVKRAFVRISHALVLPETLPAVREEIVLRMPICVLPHFPEIDDRKTREPHWTDQVVILVSLGLRGSGWKLNCFRVGLFVDQIANIPRSFLGVLRRYTILRERRESFSSQSSDEVEILLLSPSGRSE